jgi:hypothetical protein
VAVAEDRFVIRALCLLAGLTAAGCAHHRNQSAYAPPLAPPVYPQPQQPVAFPAPPAMVPGQPVMAAPAMMAAPPMMAPGFPPAAAAAPLPTGGGFVAALPDGSCPPCEASGVMPVGYEGSMQTPPCPPGP